MRMENLSKEGTIITNTVLNTLNRREEKELTSNERNYIEGLIDMAFICGKISGDEKHFLMRFLEILS